MPLLVIFRACTAIVLIVLMSAAHAPAQESRPASQEAINKLVEQLGADDSPARAAAQKTLRELGEAARAAVEKAAQSPDLEVRQRAGALLTELNNKAIAKNIVWSLALEKTASAPVFHDGKAFVCANGQLMALEPKTGKKLWSFGEFGDDHPNLSSPVAGGAVVVVNAEGSLHAFDPATGKRLWKFAPTDEESSAADSPVLPAVADGVVHFATGKKLRAVDAATGKDKWSADCEIRSIGRPAVVDGAMCLMSAEGLYAFDIKTGKSLWDRKSPLCSRLTPAGAIHTKLYSAKLTAYCA